MNEFTYRITDQVYDWIVNDNKCIELRLYNEKSSQICVDDKIKFIVINNEKKSILVKVKGLLIYDNVDNLLEDIDINKVAPIDKEVIKELLSEIFNGQLNEHNIIGIKFDVLEISNE